MIIGFKGFDKGLKCRGFQYEVGCEYETGEKPLLCTEKGFHFCEFPLDVFRYYSPTNSRYCEVEGDGDIDRDDNDSKVAVSKIRIGAEIGLRGMIEAAIKFVFKKTKTSKETVATTGYRANAATTGDWANAATTGYRANAATTGYRANAATTGNEANAATTGNEANAATTGNEANATTTGDWANAATTGYGANASALGRESIACGIGIRNKAKAALGCWIVLAEWEETVDNCHIKDVQCAHVDGTKIKADTWYCLENGQFVEHGE
jgi:hypothetical protein